MWRGQLVTQAKFILKTYPRFTLYSHWEIDVIFSVVTCFNFFWFHLIFCLAKSVFFKLISFNLIACIWIHQWNFTFLSNRNWNCPRHLTGILGFFVLNLILSDLAILYRFVLQNVKTKYYPTPSGNRTQAPWLLFQYAPFWATEACTTWIFGLKCLS